MKDPPLFQVEEVAAARPSYGSDTDNEFDEVDSDTKHSGNKVGGAMSTNMEARLILRRFWSKQASLTSPSLFAKMTGDKGSYFSASDEDDDYIPEEEPTAEGLYDDDELFQDDKEEDLEDLSYYRSDAKFGVGRKLNAGGPPKPDVSSMSKLEATMVLNNWKVDQKAYNDKVQRGAKKLMTKAEKISYVENWKAKNRKMLIEGGVWPPRGGDQVVLNPLKFLSGFCFCSIECTENGSPSSDGISS